MARDFLIFGLYQLRLGFPMQVDFTCAQFRTIREQLRAFARNGIASGNPLLRQTEKIYKMIEGTAKA